MRQQILTGLEKCGKTTKHARFLAQMERVVPWAAVCAVIEPRYPTGSPEGGRPPIPLERIVRI